MWLEAILTQEDLTGVLAQFSPLEIRLGKGGKLLLAMPRDLSMVPDEGVRIVCDVTLHWPFLGVDVPIHAEGLSLVLRPTVEAPLDAHATALVFRMHIERTGVSSIPALIDARITSIVNDELAKKHVELSWNFPETLSHVFALPASFESASGLALDVSAGRVKITSDALGFAVTVDANVERAPRSTTLIERVATKPPALPSTRATPKTWRRPTRAMWLGLLALAGSAGVLFALGRASMGPPSR
jgi:hypothetical protein